jgi:hypothetical protein
VSEKKLTEPIEQHFNAEKGYREKMFYVWSDCANELQAENIE